MDEWIIQSEIFTDVHCIICLKQNDVTTVNENQSHEPTEAWIQNHTENQSKKTDITGWSSLREFYQSNLWCDSVVCMALACLYALQTMPGHASDQLADGALGGSPLRPASGHQWAPRQSVAIPGSIGCTDFFFGTECKRSLQHVEFCQGFTTLNSVFKIKLLHMYKL